MCGPGRAALITLGDRATRHTWVLAVGDRTTATVTDKVCALREGLPWVRTLTWDPGKEMAAHLEVTARPELPVFFCGPPAPWQRGTNENTNKVLRRQVPKGTDLADITQERANTLADRLNTRPMGELSWDTPTECRARASRTSGLNAPGFWMRLYNRGGCQTLRSSYTVSHRTIPATAPIEPGAPIRGPGLRRRGHRGEHRCRRRHHLDPAT